MSNEEKQLDGNAIIARYKEMQSECNNITTKITELEYERNEHELVIETLKPLDPKRRAFRLVGGVLVERTVEEVLPSVKENCDNLSAVISSMNKQFESKRQELVDWKVKYNIKTAEEAEAINKQQQ